MSESGICSIVLISARRPRACAQKVLGFCFLRHILARTHLPGWTWAASSRLQKNDNQPLRDSHRLVTHYAKLAASSSPSLIGKSVSPHMIRHTTAVHLLRAGVDINTIRAWLGHVSLDTTNIYAEVDMEMKAKALASVDISDEFSSLGRRKTLPSLMAFLKGL
jgi:hypothetical protein